LGARSFAPVHINGKTENPADDAALPGQMQKASRIGREGCAANGLHDCGQQPIRVADRDAYGLGAEIKTQQCTPRGQMDRSFFQRQNGRHASR
jgi:hypothetical protein